MDGATMARKCLTSVKMMDCSLGNTKAGISGFPSDPSEPVDVLLPSDPTILGNFSNRPVSWCKSFSCIP